MSEIMSNDKSGLVAQRTEYTLESTLYYPRSHELDGNDGFAVWWDSPGTGVLELA